MEIAQFIQACNTTAEHIREIEGHIHLPMSQWDLAFIEDEISSAERNIEAELLHLDTLRSALPEMHGILAYLEERIRATRAHLTESKSLIQLIRQVHQPTDAKTQKVEREDKTE